MSGARLVRVGSPYNAVELAELDVEQDTDVMYLAHIDHAPGKLSRLSHTSWTFSDIAFGPTLAAPTGMAAVATTPNIDDPNDGASYYPRASAYVVCAINDDTGQTSRASASASVTNDLSLKGNYNSLSCTAVDTATRYAWFKEDNGSNTFGYIGTSTGPAFLDNNGGVTPDYTDTPPQGKNPFAAAGDYPSTVTLHQQRLIWARTKNKPNAFFPSQSADFENMDVSQPTKPDDAFSYAITSRTVNSINQMASLPNSLVAFTSGALFSITGAQGGDDPIAPTSISDKPGVSRGSSRLDPIVLDSVAFYVTQEGGYVRTVGYSFEQDGNKSDNISIFSPHLFDGFGITSWAYSEFPLSCIWAVRSDGMLLCLTWEQEQDVWGWTLCETNGTVESVACIPENGENRVYLSVWRDIDGTPTRFIERMASALAQPIEDSCFTDCSVTVDYDTPTKVITHLDHLEGCAVAVLADGSYVPNMVVEGGQIAIPNAASTVTVGLAYDCQIQTLPLIFNSQQSGLNTGKRQMVGKAAIAVENTRGIFAGPSFDATKLLEVKPRSTEKYGAPNALLNDIIELDQKPSWNAQQSLCLSFPYPLPATVLAAYLEPVVSPDA